MSKQSSLDRFFKSKSSPSPAIATMSDKKNYKKRRSLSLVEPPEKAPKMSSPSLEIIKTEPEIVNLCSDDENTPPMEDASYGCLSQNSMQSDTLNSSQSTVLYTLTPTTPQKSPQPSSSNSSRTPRSREKFYSPTKKRAVTKRINIKRNLDKEYNGSSSQSKHNSVEDEDFNKACEGMDDKSIFLLTIINKCLKDGSLKNLLDTRSAELLHHCFHIIKPGVRLVCRLYWRQHRWYRKDMLVKIAKDKNEDIGDSQFEEMVNCLVDNGLVKVSAVFGTNTMTFDDFAHVLKCDEMKQICKGLHLKIKSKEEATEALRRFSQKSSISKFFNGSTSNNSRRVLEIMRTKVGTCYKLSGLAIRALYKLYLLMYLGMNYDIIRDKGLEMMLINIKSKQEVYPIDKEMSVDNASVVFRSSEEFDGYVSAHLIYEGYLAETEISEKCSIVMNVYKLYKEIDEEDMLRYKALPTWLSRYTPTYLYIKILESGIQELKKKKSESLYQVALDILTTLISQSVFRQHKKAEWYAEKALILHKLMARHDEAAEVLLEGLKSNLSDETKDAMRPRANKIANQLNIQLAPGLSEALIEYGSKELLLEKTFHAEHVWKQHMENSKQRGKKKFEVHTDGERKFVDAEDYCVIHYTSNGNFTHGEHWEGRIVTTIYHLLFWDIIYAKPRGVVGIFLSHYQRHPLDMYHESFYINRKGLVDDRLTTIEKMGTNELIEVLKHKWEERPEQELSGIHRNIGWDNVRMVGTCLGSKATAAICRRLATNYGYAHSGFPDLTLWNMNTRKIKFVEVKTDTDKPSMKQLQWMQYLRDCGVDTGFCYVGVSSTRSRKRAPTTPMEKPPTPKTHQTTNGETPLVTVKSVSDINRTVRNLLKDIEAEL